MPEAQTTPNMFGHLIRRLDDVDDNSLPKKQRWSESLHSIEKLAQDQVVIKIAQGLKIDTYRGRQVDTGEDCQSDYDYTKASLEVNLSDLIKQYIAEKLWNRTLKIEGSFTNEMFARADVIEGQINEQVVDVEPGDITQWTSGQLTQAIMDPKTQADMSRLREMILVAEDTGFTIEESKQLSPWLLRFAEQQRDSNDPQDEAAIWSAIRTGASMLRPCDADNLLALLEPGHSIETSLVTVKMIGRIFEAQPPSDVDEHPELAKEVCLIADHLLNPYAITVSQSAAMAQLAIYALAAMASSETQRIIEIVKGLGENWFAQQTCGELGELRDIWANRDVPVTKRPVELLNRAIQTLECD